LNWRRALDPMIFGLLFVAVVFHMLLMTLAYVAVVIVPVILPLALGFIGMKAGGQWGAAAGFIAGVISFMLFRRSWYQAVR